MGLLDKIFAAGRVIKAGESLKEPAAWKNVQLLANVFVILLGAVTVFAPIGLSEMQIHDISYGLAELIAALNLYFTAATSEKVGLPSKKKR